MAKKLQDEENRLAAEAEAEAQPSRQATTVPPSVSTPIPQHSPHSHEDKKKKDVSAYICISFYVTVDIIISIAV